MYDAQLAGEYETEKYEADQFQTWLDEMGGSNFSCHSPQDLYQDILFDMEEMEMNWNEYLLASEVHLRANGFTTFDTLLGDLTTAWDAHIDRMLDGAIGQRRFG